MSDIYKNVKDIVLVICFFLSVLTQMAVFSRLSQSATAIHPRRIGSDGHFKTWLYRTNGVYYFEGYYQHPVKIEFASDEKIETVYLPKPNAWSITTIGNMMLLTPVIEDAETTMTVMTNKRTYYFEMHPRIANGAIDEDVPYSINFRYTNTHRNDGSTMHANGSIIQYNLNKVPDLANVDKYNLNYTVSGDVSITPIKIFDDGKFTYFEFRDGGDIPVALSVDSDGNESPVNYRIVNQYFVVDGTNAVFTLRNGHETVCVFNETLRGISRNLTDTNK